MSHGFSVTELSLNIPGSVLSPSKTREAWFSWLKQSARPTSIPGNRFLKRCLTESMPSKFKLTKGGHKEVRPSRQGWKKAAHVLCSWQKLPSPFALLSQLSASYFHVSQSGIPEMIYEGNAYSRGSHQPLSGGTAEFWLQEHMVDQGPQSTGTGPCPLKTSP